MSELADREFVDALPVQDAPTMDDPAIAFPVAPRNLRAGGPCAATDMHVIPSVVELARGALDQGMDLLDPIVAALLPARDVMQFCTQHRIDLDTIGRLIRGQERYEILIERGWLQNIFLNFTLYETGDPLRATDVPLPIAEVHSPPMVGCTSSYRVATEDKQSLKLSVSVRGVGAGGGVNATVSLATGVTSANQCAQITIPGDITVVPWTNPDLGKTIYVVSVTNFIANSWSTSEIPADRLHLCSDRFDETRRMIKGDLTRRRGTDFVEHTAGVDGVTIDSTLLRKRSREFVLTVGDIVEIKSRFSTEHSYPYVLVPRADYLGFYESRDSEVIFWTWKVLGPTATPAAAPAARS
jgi:hypothetical protein